MAKVVDSYLITCPQSGEQVIILVFEDGKIECTGQRNLKRILENLQQEENYDEEEVIWGDEEEESEVEKIEEALEKCDECFLVG